MQQEITVEEAFLQCEDICRKASSTFFASFSALPIKKRKAVHAKNVEEIGRAHV